MKSGWISTAGDYIVRLENALAEYHSVEHAVACNSGTSALHVALLLSGVRPDDEVIVPTVTFIAPVNAVRYAGAWPVFIDCDEYCNIDVEGVRGFLRDECVRRDGGTFNKTSGRRVAALIAVHIFGTPVDVDPLVELARDYRLRLVEDGAESLGSEYKGRKCGSLAPLGCLSFNGNKIVTTGGGGAILTNDAATAKQAKFLTTQAKTDGIGYIHPEIGYNYRMNNMLAAFGLAQLETIDERLACKRRNFALYAEALGPVGGRRLLGEPAYGRSNRWFYGYICADAAARERLLAACAAADIQVRLLWLPNHLQQPYAGMQSYRIGRALEFYARLVNIPCSVGLTQDQLDRVVAVIRTSDNL